MSSVTAALAILSGGDSRPAGARVIIYTYQIGLLYQHNSNNLVTNTLYLSRQIANNQITGCIRPCTAVRTVFCVCILCSFFCAAVGCSGARLAIVPQEPHQPIRGGRQQEHVGRRLLGARDREGRARECWRAAATGRVQQIS